MSLSKYQDEWSNHEVKISSRFFVFVFLEETYLISQHAVILQEQLLLTSASAGNELPANEEQL